MNKALILWIFIFALFGSHAMAQDEEGPPQEAPFVNSEEDLDTELQSVNEAVTAPPPPQKAPEKTPESTAEVLAPAAPSISVKSNISATPIAPSRPQFVKPEGPTKGGAMRVPHPNAAKGLIRINADGSYQYKTALRPKNKSASLRLGVMTPPKISGANSGVGTLTYKTMYGEGNIPTLLFDYEWQPFTSMGKLGFVLGTGIATARGNGYFKTSRGSDGALAQEVYTLYILPLSVLLQYRFEYARRQKIVPFVFGGATTYGLIEARDDGKATNFAGAATAGGGGGLLFSVTAWDKRNAFTLSEEYGISDMYFVLEGRAMQGLNSNIDFTNQALNFGVTVDF